MKTTTIVLKNRITDLEGALNATRVAGDVLQRDLATSNALVRDRQRECGELKLRIEELSRHLATALAQKKDAIDRSLQFERELEREREAHARTSGELDKVLELLNLTHDSYRAVLHALDVLVAKPPAPATSKGGEQS
jgi:hypothetical protein